MPQSLTGIKCETSVICPPREKGCKEIVVEYTGGVYIGSSRDLKEVREQELTLCRMKD